MDLEHFMEEFAKTSRRLRRELSCAWLHSQLWELIPTIIVLNLFKLLFIWISFILFRYYQGLDVDGSKKKSWIVKFVPFSSDQLVEPSYLFYAAYYDHRTITHKIWLRLYQRSRYDARPDLS